MKFAVGYQLADPDEEPFVDLVREFADHIAEIYFPWADMPSGRAALTTTRGYTDWSARSRMECELGQLREMGVRLDVLFNANCYGGLAVSTYLENQVVSVLDRLEEVAGGTDIATTTSPAVAHIIKKHYPTVEVRASVNMRIGTVQGMQYLAGLFDSFHVQRDYQRNLAYLRNLKEWADANGKTLHILANSGCLRFCSGQSFHDNLVAHENEVDETCNMTDFRPHTCWNFLREAANWPTVLQSTWIRPEDIHHYADMFSQMKLATRMHARPRSVIMAYINQRYRGNLTDIFEPGFGPALSPWIIDNERFPEDWFATTSTCDMQCHRCDYCARVLEKVLVNFGM